VTLQHILQTAYPDYERTPPLPFHVRKAARAIMQWRTAALGGHVQACPEGHRARIWDNACRHRACPQGADLQTARWLALQQARLRACAHDQVLFPLPHDLHPLWLANVPMLTTRLFQAVRDPLGTLLAAPKYVGAPPGISAAWQTWSQTLLLPPPLHGLVTGGGRTSTGQGMAVRHGCLWPARVVMAVLRGKRLAAIRRAWARGALVLPATIRPQQWGTLRTRLGHPTKTRGNVRIMARYRHGAGVVT
jgi:Transposase zinc-binding domain/Putative transposase